MKNTSVRSYVHVPLDRHHHPQIAVKVPGSLEKTKYLPKFLRAQEVTENYVYPGGQRFMENILILMLQMMNHIKFDGP